MPDWSRYVRTHLPPLAARPEREAEIVEELAQQLEQAYEQALARGLNEAAAEQAAREEVRDWTRFARELTPREQAPPGDSRWSQFAHDLRQAVRLTLRQRASSLLSVAVIALAIGAGTAVFSLVNAILFRPLPYADAERLTLVETRSAARPGVDSGVSGLDFRDLRSRATSFAAMAGVSPVWGLTVRGQQGNESVEGLFVSAELFPLLGAQPALGRVFRPDEESGRSLVAVISHDYWQRQFGGSRAVIGARLPLEPTPATVVGVLPPNFRYLGRAGEGFTGVDIWLPLALNPLMDRHRALRFLQVIAKRRADVSPERASEELQAFGTALASAYPGTNSGFAFHAVPVLDRVTSKARQPLLLLLAAIVLALGIACANLASVRLANLAARTQEVAVRQALGGSPVRLARQWLLESLIPAAAGAVGGWLLASVLLKALVQLAPLTLPRREEISLDERALAFAVGTALLAGVLPALAAIGMLLRGPAASLQLREGLGVTGLPLRRAIVMGEVALGVVLALGAGLLVRSFRASLASDAGYRKANLLTLSTQLPASLARDPVGRDRLLERIFTSVRAVPGVVEVGAGSRLPLTNSSLTSWFTREGKPSRPGERPEAEYRRATPGYFRAMGIALRRGRLWDERDRSAGRDVTVINETAARRFFAGEDPLGQRVRFGDGDEPWSEVIGVIADVRHAGLDADPLPEAYQPQYLSPLTGPLLAVQTQGTVSALTVQAAIRQVDPSIAVFRPFAIEDLIDRSLASRKFAMALASGFALAALLLAALGVYGVMTQMVAQRTREIGLRMALGAAPGGVLRLVLRDGSRLALLGGAVGVALALWLVRWMRSLLFGVEAYDPWTFALAPLALVVLAALASLGPARRASRVDPIVALRQE